MQTDAAADSAYDPESGEMPSENQKIPITILPREIRFRVATYIGNGPAFALNQVPPEKRAILMDFFSKRNEEILSRRTGRAPHGGLVALSKIPKPLLPE